MDPLQQGPIDISGRGQPAPVQQPAADPLNAIQTEQAPPDPLNAIPLTPITQDDDEATTRRSAMYAMGNLSKVPVNEDESLFQVYANTAKSYNDAIRIRGDDAMRYEFEMDSTKEAFNMLTDMANQSVDMTARNAAVKALSVTLQERAATQAKIEAEKRWAESVAALREDGRDSAAELSIMAHNTPDVMDHLIDMQTIRAMLMRKMEDANVKNKDRNWMLWISDAIMYMLPFGTTAAHTNTYDASKKDLTDPLFPGRRFNEETSNAWNAALNARTNDERQAVVDKVWDHVNKNVTTMFGPNEMLRLQILHEYGVTPSADWMNLEALLQNGPTMSIPAVRFGSWGLKALTTPYKVTGVLKGFGASGKAKRLVEEVGAVIKAEGPEAAMKKYGVSSDEVVENLTPDAFNGTKGVATKIDEANPPPYHNGTPVDSSQALHDGEQAFKQLIGELQIIERLRGPEKEAALKDLAERATKFMIQSNDRKRAVLNVEMKTEVFANGTEAHHVSMVIGKSARKSEEPWFTKVGAEREARRMGVPEKEVQVVEVGPDQWGVVMRVPLDETGRSLGGAPIYAPLTDRLKSGALAGLAKFFSGGKITLSDHLFGDAALTNDKINKINAAVKRELLPKFYKIDKQDKDLLAAILIKGERDKTWYDEGQLRAFHRIAFGNEKNPDKFIDAYWAAKDINDIDYYLRNVAAFTELHVQGYEQVLWGDLVNPVNGKVFRNVSEVPEEAIWDVEGGYARVQRPVTRPDGTTPPDTRLTLNDLQTKQGQGYVIVRTEEPQKMANGAMVRYFLIKGDKLETRALSLEQLPYYPGGHRMYRANYFVKMGRKGTQPWGEVYFDTPFTPTAALTRAEGAEWADVANQARSAYKAAVDANLDEAGQLAAIRKVFDETESGLSFPDEKEFLGWMKEHKADNPFEVVYDREMPSMYSGAADGRSSWGDNLSGINTYMQTQGRMFVSRKGPTLKNIRDWSTFAETYDPFTTLNESMKQIARMSSLTDYKLKSVNKWVSTYRDALDATSQNLAPMQMFLKGTFRSGTKDLQAIKQAAELQRSVIKRTLGWKSDFDVAVENSMRQLSEYWAGNKVGPRSKAVHASFDWWAETKPINAAMGLAYDATMGLFNIAQFPLQVQTSLAAMSIDTSKGARAMANLPAVWLWMRKAADESTLEWLISKGAHTAAGFDTPEEYIQMMKAIKRTGWLDNMLGAMKSEFGPNSAMGAIGTTVDDLRRSGRFFTDKAEEVNRINAWQMAWHMTKERYPKLVVDSPEFISRVRSLSSTLTANMDEAGAAAWQRNSLAKLPTQFMAYMARWHELLFTKDLTKVDKMRFVAGQAFLYGTAGIPFGAYVAEELQNAAGTTPDIGTLEGFASRGFADTLLWYATGMDLDFSSRAGIGLYPTDLIKEFFGVGRYGDPSAAALAFGATGQIFNTVKDASFEAFKYAVLESGGESNHPVTMASIERIARSISTLNNIYKAEAIFKYGQYTNRKGEAILDDLPSSYGWAALLGINPAEFRKQSAEIAWMENRKKAVDQWVEVVQVQRVKFGQAVTDQDWEEARKLGEDINFISRNLIPKDIKKDVMRKAFEDPRTQTVAESIAKRYEEQRNHDELAKRNTQ